MRRRRRGVCCNSRVSGASGDVARAVAAEAGGWHGCWRVSQGLGARNGKDLTGGCDIWGMKTAKAGVAGRWGLVEKLRLASSSAKVLSIEMPRLE